ncbi:MAG: hypothetical protein LBH33_02115, partial [Endomicrobium sp.]|nr:hypothetical protein [Endomicrobium sp.]
MMIHNIRLTNQRYFKFHMQSLGFNKEKLNKMNTSDSVAIPVYTAAREAVAYINTILDNRPISASKTEPLLSFATNGDGSAGKNFVLHTNPFYINRDRIALSSLMPNDISLEFVWYQLRNMKAIYGFDHHYKANSKNLEIVDLEIPVKTNGEFDIEKQRKIVKKWTIYRNFIKNIEVQIKKLEMSFIMPKIKFRFYKTITLGDSAFEFITTKLGIRQSEYRFIDTSDRSDIPMYTAQFMPVAYVKKIYQKLPIMASENDPCISIADDGDGTAGRNIIYHTCPYYQNTSRISFRIKQNDILPEYVYYKLQNIKTLYGFNFQYKAKKENLESVAIEIPCDNDGFYSINDQNRYITRCKKLNDISEKILSLSNII